MVVEAYRAIDEIEEMLGDSLGVPIIHRRALSMRRAPRVSSQLSDKSTYRQGSPGHARI
jgi:hypothetical protein